MVVPQSEMGKSSVRHNCTTTRTKLLSLNVARFSIPVGSVVYLTGNADGFQSAPTIVLDQALGPDGYTTFARVGSAIRLTGRS